MLGYIVRRLLAAIPIALGVSMVCYALVYLAPGDPVQTLLPPDADAETVARLRALYGLDRPIVVQYLDWLVRVASGDFGRSIANGRPVIEEIQRSLGNTVLLAGLSVLIAFSIAFVLGVTAGRRSGSWIDRLVTGVAVLGVSIPNYWLAIVLVIIFAVEWGVLPPMGIGPENSTGWRLDGPHLAHMVLPTIALSVIPLGVVTRTVRSTIKEILNSEFVTPHHAKGLRDDQILRHVLKNAAPTCLAVMGLQAGNLIGGSILIETVFAWPGTGFLLNSAIFRRDLPILQGTTLVLAFFFMMLNLAVDVVQTMVDPRIKRG